MLEHGGRLRAAAERLGIPKEEWLDLSTGINPATWPVPEIPSACWNRLPEEEDGLTEAARAYYGAPAPLLAAAGSQAIIQALPRVLAPTGVGIVSPTYAEHPHAWRQAGHGVVEIDPDRVEEALPGLGVLVAVNPNNPTGRRYSRERLLSWRDRLAPDRGLLVVDEAFMDADPAQSVAPSAATPGLVVLRSLGKFFGLAGARVGFAFAEEALLARLAEHLGPWTLNHPARWAATLALNDREWQSRMREALPKAAKRLAALLADHGLAPAGGTALFQYVPHEAARALQEALLNRGILVRAFDAPAALRFGLPGNEAAWKRLQKAVEGL